MSSDSDNTCVDANNNIKYNFLGLKENIDKEHILKVFDTNYIPLSSLPISYYNTTNPTVNDNNDELLSLLQKINNTKNIYNNYNITPIYYTVIIVLAVPIIILSIWFVYINNQSL